MRVTVDSQATKDRIIKVANITGRWGTAGGHTVFFRDIPPEKYTPNKDREENPKGKRTSSKEDRNMSKKPRCEE